MKVKIVRYAYFAILIADIIIRLMNNSELDKFVKPLIMPVLIYYLIERTAGKIYKNHLLLAGALITAWVGDILLLNDEKVFLLGGILAFLITQIIYLFIFKSNTIGSFKELISQNKLVTAILLISYGMFSYLTISQIEGYIKFAVLIYGFIVTTATWYSHLQNKESNYLFLKAGMSIFLISDSLLATNLFFFKVPLAPMLIIGTYGVSQYLITEGIIKHTREQVH